MRKALLIVLVFPLQLFAQNFTKKEISGWQNQAQQVTIIRDNWGISHIYGKTDADAVFGLLYAQCEDDFKRVEMNYIEKLGRMAEVKGITELYNDLLIRLLIDTADAIKDYDNCQPWFKKLLNAYADGINYYLFKHPEVKPLMLYHFKPWYPLLWTDGSIGAINTADITTADLQNFYSDETTVINKASENEERLDGSNGFAIAPSKTASGNSILYINPHVTFYFRPEVHVISEEGLNAYGAITWGQFFVYQGFNQHCGWMHTSSNVDVADLYEEKILKKDNKFFYEYEHELREVKQTKIVIRYSSGQAMQAKTFNTFFTHHGPIMAKRNGKWISLRSNNRSITSLLQSWQRTKAKGFEEYKKVMELKANTSNNTVFADDKGNIAYWHGNFIPVRDISFNWAKPVDGSITATEWKGSHKVNETVHIYNPENGWIQNCNSTPFTAAGSKSPKKENYPAYMAPDGENFRGINAVKVLSRETGFTLDKIIAAGYDTYLPAFEILIPALVNVFEKNIKADDSFYIQLHEPISILKSWDYRSSENSIATTLAIEWAEKLSNSIRKVYIDEGEEDQIALAKKYAASATVADVIPPLASVITELKNKFGKWQVPWGEINRFQRLTGDLEEKFTDDKPSLPVGYASSLWGMLPSYSSNYFPGTNKRYGIGGNSFICAVEFGKKIKAKSLLAGGESGNPTSKHFKDQALMYAKGQFKDVLFYKEDVMKNAERTYHPGE